MRRNSSHAKNILRNAKKFFACDNSSQCEEILRMRRIFFALRRISSQCEEYWRSCTCKFWRASSCLKLHFCHFSAKMAIPNFCGISQRSVLEKLDLVYSRLSTTRRARRKGAKGAGRTRIQSRMAGPLRRESWRSPATETVEQAVRIESSFPSSPPLILLNQSNSNTSLCDLCC
jgi:hypothetical protein